MQKPPVLIIDPDVALQEILGEILKSRFRIFTANSIEESRAVMGEEDPHLIFIELVLPGEDAIQYIERTKKSKT
ncbi:MAG: hypothetical protein JNJ69_06870, partial [Leptospiraceae bacterium]|nr:hypothetical protein [Leptospiraceae bacterium]